uniref:carboxymuconolactone decarboxylase family protein n=1 Tax=Cupriavidus yeoncheonensis TaxID=1462994 RepID=UPI003F499B1D
MENLLADVGTSPCDAGWEAVPANDSDTHCKAIDKTVTVPTMHTAMAVAPALFATYQNCCRALSQDLTLTQLEQRVVFLVLAVASGCNYDEQASGDGASTASETFRKIVAAIRHGKPLADARLRALVSFTRSMFIHRGRPSEHEVKTFLHAGYREENILDIILAIAANTLDSYTSHVFNARASGSTLLVG